MENIKIIDDTFLESAKIFKDTSDELDKAINDIASQINKAATEGFAEGNISNNLQSLYKYISDLKEELSEIGNDVKSYMENYLKDIDEADEYIY